MKDASTSCVDDIESDVHINDLHLKGIKMQSKSMSYKIKRASRLDSQGSFCNEPKQDDSEQSSQKVVTPKFKREASSFSKWIDQN